MDLSLEERKLQYIERIETEYMPVEKNWWQHPPPLYYLTKDYAAKYENIVTSGDPVIFKKARKERMIIAILVVVAALLIYLVGKNELSSTYFLFLLLLLIIVLPALLNNKAMIRVSPESIWLYKEDKNISWDQVLLTYIKEVHEEHAQFFFIVHYYDEEPGEFRSTEIELNGLVSPAILAATIEAFRYP